MSSEQMETQAKTKLAILVKSIEPIVEKQLADFSPAEIEYVLNNFRKFLTYDLTRDFEKIREKNLKESPFDAIINDDLGINNE
jgi:spore coat polysaccharide biosynthesis predicted glycosyltransferase SpsG